MSQSSSDDPGILNLPGKIQDTRQALRRLAGELRATVIPFARQLRQGDFTPTQSSIIGTIDRLQPVTMRDLATAEKLSLPVVSRIITRLESEGLIERVVRDNDRRVQWISLSEDFKAELRRNRADRNDALAEQLAALSDDDIAVMVLAIPLLKRLMNDALPPMPDHRVDH